MDNLLRKQQLNRMKLFATALMLFMAVVLVISRLQGNHGIWHWITAFSEAALIGALADWFAIVAIFRHPLNLPIPRTAIIPENKERIAQNLAVFIKKNFLNAEIIIEKLRAFKPAEHIGSWLSSRNNADRLSRQVVLVLIGALAFIDDQRVGKILRNTIHKRLQQTDLGHLLGQLFDVLTQNNQHQALLNEGLKRISTVLDEPATQRYVASIIIEVSKREHPKLLAMLGIMMDTAEFSMKLSASLVESIQNWLHDIGKNASHPRRKQFDMVVENFITRIKNDPSYHQRVENWKQQFLSTPVVSDYFETLWVQLRQWMQKDAAEKDSRLQVRFSHSFRHFGRWIQDNPELCDSINEHLIKIISSMSEELQASVTDHVVSTIIQWDDQSLVRELELTVGRDLQFIRINGTLVGGIIGLILHAFVLFLTNL